MFRLRLTDRLFAMSGGKGGPTSLLIQESPGMHSTSKHGVEFELEKPPYPTIVMCFNTWSPASCAIGGDCRTFKRYDLGAGEMGQWIKHSILR